MANFMIRFLICNVFISGIIGILLIAKRLFKNSLSSRMQYNLWFLLLGFETHYQWNSNSENVSVINLSEYFGKYDGSFVLYDLGNDTWNIHDLEHATLRVAPNSTYKIYDALFGLEEGVITPENTFSKSNMETKI